MFPFTFFSSDEVVVVIIVIFIVVVVVVIIVTGITGVSFKFQTFSLLTKFNSVVIAPVHYGTKPGHFETSKIHFPTSEGVSEVNSPEQANK